MKIVWFILICGTLISCQTQREKPFEFVQLCDTQLGMGGYEHDVKAFEQAVVQINELNPDFVLICGDLVHHASDTSYRDFKRILSGLKMMRYPLPGNHDVENVPTKESLAYFRKVIGKDYTSFEHKGYAFVLTNTQLWKEEVAGESQKHQKWFESIIKSKGAQNMPIVVAGHYPIFLKSPYEEEEYFNLPLDVRSEILDLMKTHNVKAYLSGHKHELLVNEFEEIQFVSGESTSKNFDNRPLGFRVWKVTLDSMSHDFIPLDFKI